MIESMTDDELSAILKQWQMPPAPASLEARVFRARAKPGPRWWKWSAAAALLCGLGLWSIHNRRLAETLAPTPGQPNAADVRQGSSGALGVARVGQERDTSVPPVRVDAKLAASKLLQAPEAVYPPAAKAAGIQGTVKLQIVIGKDGRVVEAMVMSGNPLLAPAAIEAVNRWLYRSTLLNGQPVELVTEVEVNFRK